MDDGHVMSPAHVHAYLCKVMYARRTKSNPLWNSLVVGGYKNETPFLVSLVLYP
jgi:20S proteasome alpha/beta subunit